MTQEPATATKNRAAALWLVLGLLVGGSLAGALAWQTATSTPSAIDRMSLCQKELDRRMSAAGATYSSPESRANFLFQTCYENAKQVYRLEELSITGDTYRQQQFQGGVMLWMVVAITFSGVALAGLQLLAAFRLATDGKGALSSDGEVSLERGKISLKSSVTGLLILTVSFAFFFVYVLWVYTIRTDTLAVAREKAKAVAAGVASANSKPAVAPGAQPSPPVGAPQPQSALP